MSLRQVVSAVSLAALVGIAPTASAQVCSLYAVSSGDANTPILMRVQDFDAAVMSGKASFEFFGAVIPDDDTDGDAGIGYWKGFLWVVFQDNISGLGDVLTIVQLDMNGNEIGRVRSPGGHEHTSAIDFDPRRRGFRLYRNYDGELSAFRRKGSRIFDGSGAGDWDGDGGAFTIGPDGRFWHISGELDDTGGAQLYKSTTSKFRAGVARSMGSIKMPSRYWENNCSDGRFPAAAAHPMTGELYGFLWDRDDWECPSTAFHIDTKTRQATELFQTPDISDAVIVCQ